jgi:hypothetical protein
MSNIHLACVVAHFAAVLFGGKDFKMKKIR